MKQRVTTDKILTLTLAAGTRLGPYEITGPIGASVQGEVYKARDSRLERTVAINLDEWSSLTPASFALLSENEPNHKCVREVLDTIETRTVGPGFFPMLIKNHPRGPQSYNSSVMATTTPSTVYAHITRDPEVCGGKACIDGTRIRVMDIVALEREGYVPEKMLHVFAVALSLGQVYGALAYYYDHKDEIEASFEAQEQGEKESERKRAEFLKHHSKR